LEVVGLKWMVCWLWLWSICLWNGLLFHLPSFCYLHGLHMDWMQFGFGFNSELFAQLTKFLISNACLKNLQVIWKMDCLTWRWANLLRLGQIWVLFYSIFQLWQSTKLIPPTIELIFYSPIWIRLEAR
jgi:hypothetical protein